MGLEQYLVVRNFEFVVGQMPIPAPLLFAGG